MPIKPNNFVINAADLAYMLRQIKIAEATSAGYTPAVAPVSIVQAIMNEYSVSAANAGQLPAGLRTVDGTFNNLLIAPTGTPGTPGYNPGTSEFGAADTLFPRLTTPVYNNDADGDQIAFGPPGSGAPVITNTNYAVTGSVADADPRIISNLIVSMSVDNPAAVSTYLNNPLSLEAFEAAHPGMTPVAPGDPRLGTGPYLALTNADLQVILNQSPDIGLSPGFNSWMTYFGQFFDHGLDLVTKGASGTVYIPLQADDPLIAGADGILLDNPATTVNEAADNLPAHLQFMALTRATQTLDANGVPQHENTTTSWIDQNQTYTSHASHQVFLREYVKVDLDGAGVGLGPVAISTGRLLDGTTAGGSVNGAVGNWGEVKAQAITMLGIKMNDFDVHNAPLLATDQYGKFLPGSNGYAQVAVQVQILDANGKVIGSIGSQFFMNGVDGGLDLANLAVPAGLPALPAGQTYHTASVGTGHAFLNDIAHHAAPGKWDHDNNPATPKIAQTADTDPGVGDDGLPGTYDDEMLNAHFITGDGRGNENIALTAVHSIFHSEHNRTVEDNKLTILATAAGGDLTFLNEWLLVDVTAVPVNLSSLVWDGDRLFQAGRFSTEMQYQHLVFEEFGRRIQPMIDPFLFQNSPNIDPSIVAEFAHTVYRFGHSMLTGTVDRLDNSLGLLNGDTDQQTLLAMFLNPQAYIGSGATVEQINANIVRGLSRDVGNQIDEFIINDVRSNLLGLPLDLGALNIARGRDTGIPSLNETRAQLYNNTGLADLKPYVSWVDFAAHLKNAASIVNFIAAYGTHSTITSETTLVGKRAAAEAIVFNTAGAPADRLDFINATGIYAPDGVAGPNNDSRGGLELVDLWIGGLAEAHPEFGGMLGSTFNYVFEAQMESLQDGDRMYYLSRTQGQNFLNQLEPNTFADLVMRNTDLGDQYATHLHGFLFVTPDHFLELDRGIKQEDYNGSANGLDPTWAPGEPHSPFDMKVTRTYTGVLADGTHDVGGTLRFIGGEHVVLGGTEGNDKLYGDRGIDTLWGDGGDDYLNAGTESDNVFGGEGDDIIEDPFGDDILRGNAGNDVITSARGFDLLFGNEGKDAIFVGQDAGEAFGGSGDDFIVGGQGADGLFGNEGDDWIEGGNGLDTLSGDNSEIFFNSLIIGNDVLFGQGDENNLDAESGDDIMGSGPSVFRYEGMYGFDYVIAKGDIAGVDFDMTLGVALLDPAAVLRDRFDKVESISGYTFDDILKGDNRGHFVPGTVTTGATADPLFVTDILTQTGINLINGFNAWFGGARQTLFGGPTPLVIGSEGVTSFRDGNIILGGDGNDLITGQRGFDLLDGDAYLNVRIGIDLNGVFYSAESLTTDVSAAGQYAGKVYAMVGNNPLGEVNFAAGPAFGGRSLNNLLLDRTINPGQMSIVREIKYDATNVTGALMNIDTAVYHGTLAEYDIEGRTVDANGRQLTRARDVDGDGFISVTDRDDGVTGATVNGVVLTSRRLLVDDTDLIKNIEELRFADQTVSIVPKPPTVDLHAFNILPMTAQYVDNFNVQSFSNSNGITPWTTAWVETNDDTNVIDAGQIQLNVDESEALRFAAGDGASISRAVSLAPGASTTLSYVHSFSGLDTGDTLKVEFAANGIDFITIQTIAGAVANNANLGPTLSTFTVNGTASSALRFTASTLTDIEGIRIDDLSMVTTNTAQHLDNFSVQSSSNSNGNTLWGSSWVETNDGANLIGAGQIQLNVDESEALRFAAGDGASITRAISLDPSASTTLSYVHSFSGLDTGDTLIVEFAADGVNFVTIQTIAGAVANNANLGPTLSSFTVNGTADSALRFTVSTLTDIEGIRIDDVSFVRSALAPVPVNNGTGFASTFIEDGAAVAIASLSSITDPDNVMLLSAQVRLTNAQALDVLAIAGALPTGITASFGPPVAGQITLNLSGSASKAAYQTAIEAVRFSNSSQNPSTILRNIEVRATSVDGTSPAAIARVTVVGVNDAPVTVADAIVTNISTGNIVVPEWALLKNDSDVDNAVLDITAVSAAVGVTGLSLVTNPGSVTLADDGTAGGSFIYTANDGGVAGTTNGAVTMTNTGYASVADNFNGLNTTTPSAANNSTGSVSWAGTNWTEANDDANIRTGQIQIDGGASPGTNDLRVGVGDGGSISRAVDLSGAASATLSLNFDKNGIDVGESVEVQFAADGINFVTLDTITNTNGTVASGNAAGTLTLALTGALSANSTIRFVGSAINTLGEDIRIDNVAVRYALTNAAVTAGAGNQILVGNDAGSNFSGGLGDDIILANGGDDIITWGVGDGRDFIDGGANGVAGDRVVINGDATVEAFIVYARAEAIAAGVTVQNAGTEIVITRNAVVIAELDNVEEITINTGLGADSVAAVGNFGPTSLFFNTVTVNGGGGRDTIDTSLLTSAHKLVLVGSSGGMVRPMVEFDGFGMSGKSLMTRKAMFDMDDFAALGNAGSSQHSGFAIGGQHNPMYDRVVATDSAAYDLGHAPQIGNNAVHLYAADYLII
ncbi:MAG: hypothetical protein LH610_04260 [Sphingomonas bacterium]|nr:hypothetical protein [Sphingomonas bacterium]